MYNGTLAAISSENKKNFTVPLCDSSSRNLSKNNFALMVHASLAGL